MTIFHPWRLFRILAALVWFTPAGNALAQPQTDMLYGFDDFVLHNPDAPGGKVTNYSVTAPGGHWTIAQWDIPGGNLSPFAATAKDYKATAAEADVTISKTPNGAVTVALEQNGAHLPCNHPNGGPRESDLFFGSKPKPDAFERTPLSGFKALRQIFQLSSVGANASTTRPCQTNKGAGIVSVVLTDRDVHPTQTFFYQLIVSTVCREEVRSSPCNKPHADIQFFYMRNPYGANDYLNLLGISMVSGSEIKSVDVDILPRLKRAIAIGPSEMDHDLSHWQIGGVYGGQIIWGDVTLKTVWRNYRLVAVLP